jgi:hypothetical protein
MYLKEVGTNVFAEGTYTDIHNKRAHKEITGQPNGFCFPRYFTMALDLKARGINSITHIWYLIVLVFRAKSSSTNSTKMG